MKELDRCLLCGTDKGSFDPYRVQSGYRLVKCSSCGLIFVSPRDTTGTIQKQYLEDQTSRVSYYGETSGTDGENFKKKLALIESKVPKGTLLDIGCSVGTFMETAAERGWKTAGVEVNPKAVAVCRKKGLEVHEGVFSKGLAASLPQRSFDLVCMMDAIEHFPDPVATLLLCSGLLRPGGYAAVTTPNINSVLARGFQVKPREHLFYFSPDTLRKILEKTGFRTEMVLETSRKRDIASIPSGASIEDRSWVKVAGLLGSSGLARLTGLFLEKFFSDEIFALARKG